MTYQTGINIALLAVALIVLRRATNTNNRTATLHANLQHTQNQLDDQNRAAELYNERQRILRIHDDQHRNIPDKTCPYCTNQLIQ